MKFISSTVLAATAAMASSVSVSASDLPASVSGGKLRGRKLSHSKSKSGGKCSGDDDVLKFTLVSDLLVRQAYASRPAFEYAGVFDSTPGLNNDELEFLVEVWGEETIDMLLTYVQDEGDGDGIVSRKELLLFMVEIYYGDTCISELNALRDMLEPAPYQYVQAV